MMVLRRAAGVHLRTRPEPEQTTFMEDGVPRTHPTWFDPANRVPDPGGFNNSIGPAVDR